MPLYIAVCFSFTVCCPFQVFNFWLTSYLFQSIQTPFNIAFEYSATHSNCSRTVPKGAVKAMGRTNHNIYKDTYAMEAYRSKYHLEPVFRLLNPLSWGCLSSAPGFQQNVRTIAAHLSVSRRGGIRLQDSIFLERPALSVHRSYRLLLSWNTPHHPRW